MRTVVVYRPQSDHARQVEEYLRDFTYRTGRELETMDPDDKMAEDFCRTYDIVEYPTVIVISDGGQMQNMWRGTNLPTISELSYYV